DSPAADAQAAVGHGPLEAGQQNPDLGDEAVSRRVADQADDGTPHSQGHAGVTAGTAIEGEEVDSLYVSAVEADRERLAGDPVPIAEQLVHEGLDVALEGVDPAGGGGAALQHGMSSIRLLLHDAVAVA